MSESSSFVYVVYIRTTPEKLWSALTEPEFTRKYWLGATFECVVAKGAAWRLVFDDGRLADTGVVLECDPPRRLVLEWTNQWNPEMTAEGPARCLYEIEQAGEAVKLTVTHTMDRPHSKLIGAVSGGWPKILSNLKSLLETGQVMLKDKV
ncbi:MAG: SRPBCC family protein [Hyphomicrobiales bacterium]|nr:SRPBCC family protein [Hyphomicrobiales bacterium]